jgi:hypothetical protein
MGLGTKFSCLQGATTLNFVIHCGPLQRMWFDVRFGLQWLQWATVQNETIKICEKLRASYRGHGAGFGTALQAMAQGLVTQYASGHSAK